MLGRRLPPMAKCVVGGDVRASTPAFLAALVEGLCDAGLDVVDLGILPTPVVYYAQRRMRAQGCAIVTASHNASTMNGLKWLVDGRPPTPDDVAAMACEIPADGGDRETTTPRTLDVTFDYVACLQERFVESMGASLHVVLDPMHGCWAEKARRYLHAIFPQCLFATIRDTVDPEFGGETPDCSEAARLADLYHAVYCERASLGIAFDGDGDRVALVDETGVPLTSEETVWTLLHCLAGQLPDEQVVCDQRYSDRVPEVIRKFGAEPLIERSGHAFLRARMLQSNALFGAETSGHYFYRALGGSEDGLYTACLVIEHLTRSGEKLSEIRRDCPAAFMTPELRLRVPAVEQAAVFDQIRTAWAEFPQKTLDGIRVETPCGWALVRSSVTEPALVFRFEGLDWNALEDWVERFCDALPEHGDALWMRYRAAIGGEKIP
jgi:phosphomannomutase